MYVPCFQWLPEDKTNIQTPLPQAQDDFQIELVLPITGEELLEHYNHQLGMLMIGLLPVLDLYLGHGSVYEASRFGAFLYTGLYLHSLVGWILYVSQSILNNACEMILTGIRSQEGQVFFHKHGLSTDSSVDIRIPPKPQATSLYIRTADDSGEMFSEADQMIEYASYLLKPVSEDLETRFSHDNRATMTPVYRYGENDVFHLSVTNPDNVTHSYDIAHNKGCNWLLSRDGFPVSDYITVSWYQGKDTGLSLSPINHPQSIQRNRVTIQLPGELLELGLSRANNALLQLSDGLQSRIPALVSKVIIALQGTGEQDHYVQVPKDNFVNLHSGLSVRQPGQWLLPIRAGSEAGIVQLMQNPSVDNTVQLGSSSSGNGAGSHSSGKSEGKKPDLPEGGQDEDEDEYEDRRSASGSTSSLSSSDNGMSLIELVSSRKLNSLSASSSSPHPRLVDTHFIKLLSRAGMAQVIVDEDLDNVDCPLAISTTLVQYLCATQALNKPFWLEALKRKLETDSYYIELDQELYDVMLERFESIKNLAEARAQAFDDFHTGLAGYIKRLNPIKSGNRFAVIGGEAVRMQVGFLKGHNHFLRDNFPITNDFDVLMRQGNIHEFTRWFPTYLSGYPVFVSETKTMAFPFPCQSGECFFGMHKVTLHSVWGEYLPNIDISFPDGRRRAPRFADHQSVLFESLNRAFKFKGKEQKYLDRVLLLRGLLPGSAGVELLYLREFSYPALLKEKKRLAYAAGLSETRIKMLQDRVQKQEQDIQERLREMEDFRKQSGEELEQVRRELETEMNGRLQERIKEFAEELEQEKAEHSKELQKYKTRANELDELASTKGKLAARIQGDMDELSSRIEKLQAELDASRLRQKEQEEELRRVTEADETSKADNHVAELQRLKHQKTLLQKHADNLDADNNKKKEKIILLSSRLQEGIKKIEQLNMDIELLKAQIKQQKTEAESLREQVGTLQSEKETHSVTLGLLQRQLKERDDKAELSGEEFAETGSRLKERPKQEKKYQKNKRVSNQELARVEARIEEAEQQNERLRGEVRWYRNHRNWRVAIGMIPVALVGMREFLVPRFHDAAKATCSRFKRTLTYQYCVRNWVGEESLLKALTVLEQFPGHTRISRFEEPERFEPGYFLALQGAINKDVLINFMQSIKEMHLYIPTDFMMLDNLYISELHQSLSAFFRQLTDQDSPWFVEQFAVANILLCGIMPDSDQQDKCAAALSGSFRKSRQWPCHMHNTGDFKVNACRSFMYSGFTRNLTDRFVLALLPAWFVETSGKLRWYDPWPVLMNKHRIRRLSEDGACTHLTNISRYCDGKAVKIWRFIDNHWDLDSHPCREFSSADIGTPAAFWVQSWSGESNDIFSCQWARTV